MDALLRHPQPGVNIKGLKNEVGVGMVWALGDGDVNFALEDGLETIADGLFHSLDNLTGWESDGTCFGNYTDPRLGLGFNIDRLNVILTGGPRFYSPGNDSGLSSRTHWGGELELKAACGQECGAVDPLEADLQQQGRRRVGPRLAARVPRH